MTLPAEDNETPCAIMAASVAGFRAPTRPPGTEFLDAETRRQKSPPKWVSAHRDKNPGNEWPEIPAETTARLRPSLTRCWIIERSNSAKAPVIWNINLPAGVVVSMAC
jgi:hypothetical protein